jgi:NNP family nitrate/nitrite transporter-like MFS transporter
MEGMKASSIGHKGSVATVIASFLHFDMSFTIWVLLGSLGIFITKDLRLSPAQQGLMVAIPILSGSLLRVPMGLLSDRFGGKRIGVSMLLFLFLPLLLGWLVRVNLPVILCIGLMLGVAGASFAVALPLASRWYQLEKQGLVLGICAAGNMGTVIANLFAPTLAKAYGWHDVLAFTMIPLAFVLLAFLLLAKDSPSQPKGEPVIRYLAAMKHGDLWWFCLFYAVTFGGFVGLSTFMPLFLRGQYAMNPIAAGLLTALAAFMGSTLRPLGGYLADKFGGALTLSLLLGCIGIFYAISSFLLALSVMAVVLVVGMACLGMGNGAVFQMVPQRFRIEIGVATGVVGAIGGLGGFFLPTFLGSVKQVSGSFGAGLFTLALFAIAALVILRLLVALQNGWRIAWMAQVASEVK